MPVYDYKCSKCGNTRTVTLTVQAKDQYKAVCSCGETMVREYSVGAVKFKGNGWGHQ